MKNREWKTKEILITVKTYPNPSISYRETVCMAGLTKEGEWFRLYPVMFREIPYRNRPKKYDIFRMRLYKDKRDKRPESYRTDQESFERIGSLSTDNKWFERRAWILPHANHSMCEIKSLSDKINKSIGIFKPKKVIDLIIEEDRREWDERRISRLSQMSIFNPDMKPLERIPFKFKYSYFCYDEGCRGHTQTIVDWEICQLYRNLRDKYDINEVKRKIREKYLDDICGPKRDTYFYVGDMFLNPGSFIVLGVFYPPV